MLCIISRVSEFLNQLVSLPNGGRFWCSQTHISDELFRHLISKGITTPVFKKVTSLKSDMPASATLCCFPNLDSLTLCSPLVEPVEFDHIMQHLPHLSKLEFFYTDFSSIPPSCLSNLFSRGHLRCFDAHLADAFPVLPILRQVVTDQGSSSLTSLKCPFSDDCVDLRFLSSLQTLHLYGPVSSSVVSEINVTIPSLTSLSVQLGCSEYRPNTWNFHCAPGFDVPGPPWLQGYC